MTQLIKSGETYHWTITCDHHPKGAAKCTRREVAPSENTLDDAMAAVRGKGWRVGGERFSRKFWCPGHKRLHPEPKK